MPTDYDTLNDIFQRFKFPYHRNPDTNSNPPLQGEVQKRLREINASKTIRDLGTGHFYCFNNAGEFIERFSLSELEQQADQPA